MKPNNYLTSRTLNLKFNPQFLGTKRTVNPPIGAAAAAAKAAATSKYVRTGLCAITGNCDDGGDIIQPGAFTKAIANFNAGRSRIRHLWNHLSDNPPIASVKALRELSRSEMPSALLALDPNINGGLLVTREYYPGNALSEWVLTCIDRGDIAEMSFGFQVIDYANQTIGGKSVRLLKELELYDSSDVNWGMNSATMAVVSKSFPPPRKVAPTALAAALSAQQMEIQRLELELLELDVFGDQPSAPKSKQRGIIPGLDRAWLEMAKLDSYLAFGH